MAIFHCRLFPANTVLSLLQAVLLVLSIMCVPLNLQAQMVNGRVYNAITQEPLMFVNLGIVGGNLGTVSDENGYYSLDLTKVNKGDSIRFSYLGFISQTFEALAFQKSGGGDIYLSETSVPLREIVVYAKDYTEKILGNQNKSSLVGAGFKENNKGYECGVLMKVKKSARLQELICYVALCTYDSLFYRMNVYKPLDDGEYEPVLNAPIYLSAYAGKVKRDGVLNFNLKKYDIEVEGDFLITLEHVKDLGEGQLFFSAAFLKSPTYYRETSQAAWQKHPVGIGFAVRAKVEK
jgi:hypothetical protein